MKKLFKNINVISSEQMYLRREISQTPQRRPERSRRVLVLMMMMFFILTSCNSKIFDTKEELWSYLKDESNGYVQHKNVNGIDFSLLYKPTDLMVQQELDDSSDAKKIATLREKYNQYIYFSLSMSKNNKELLSATPKNRNEFGSMVNQLAFGMGSKVHVYTPQKDTISLLDFVYPRMYGMSRTTDILFVYPKDDKKLQDEYLNFTIEDFGLYTGEVKFKVPTKSIVQEPVLNLENNN